MNPFLIFPHQLFLQIEHLSSFSEIYLIENELFFKQYKFHQQKIILHRSSMKYYEDALLRNKLKVRYINSFDKESNIAHFINNLKSKKLSLYHPNDNWVEKQLKKACETRGIELHYLPSPNFINNQIEDTALLGSRKPFYQTGFYIDQRKRRNILIDNNQLPEGGQWTYDVENRKKIPKNTVIPDLHFFGSNQFIEEAITYTKKYFSHHYGSSDAPFGNNALPQYYPCTHRDAEKAMNIFLEQKLENFGIYEDAMLYKESTLFHSVLSPLINIGLLSVTDFIQALEKHYKNKKSPLNSVEGIIRQLMGWREFVQLTYQKIGTIQRTKNFWGFTHKMPKCFYDGSTGIPPIDLTIKKLLKNGYSHHIERLMVLGNFMLLCEIDPNEVYQWFMEMYIDAYDWVMVPNVYGMSQFSDGGMITSKPYIAGSNYLMKMGDFPKGDWQAMWDGLFWRFLSIHREVFAKNPRWAMLLKTWDKMDEGKRTTHLKNAALFLEKIHKKNIQ
ncbi:MAG: cryptochrome/photolyase family protein [Chitinophagia bacterium]|nr:cryptochrome/photolyase family protein [Chitinophagia bacterium]